jgi:hypothetical protein
MLVGLIVLGLVAVEAAHPSPVHAVDIEQSLIIAGASAGAIAVVTFIAILLSDDDDEPDFLRQAPRRRAPEDGRVRFGLASPRSCPTVGGNVSIVCW